MAKSGNRPYHHGDLHNACVEAALDLLKENGIEGVTLRGVAEKAGVSRTAPYRHFATKRDLLAACAAHGFRMLEHEVASAVASAGEAPVAQLFAGSHAYARFGAAQPHIYRLMFNGDLADSEYPEIRAAGLAAFRVPIAFLEAAQNAGIVRNTDSRMQAFALWSALHGLVTLHIDSRPTQIVDATDLQANVKGILGILLTGIAVAPVAL
ncbi:TetR/AcrR family transcriptional regulator [Azospirillum argentinense]|nr:TetR/AcrR family transcriptional regulator [Azospirillum argentinense]